LLKLTRYKVESIIIIKRLGGRKLSDKGSRRLFNLISPIYGLFFNSQRRNFQDVIKKVEEDLDIRKYEKIIDVGCGTGALCSVLYEEGLRVTGVDPAQLMLDIAIRKNKDKDIDFQIGNVLEGLDFEENSFDIAIASYVAHGLQPGERKKMYREMSRVSKVWVVIHDYNKKRNILTSIVEWLERGDYFRFIKTAEKEMKDCSHEMEECFSEVNVVDVGERAAWYICKPK